jgi:hypothetical protein
MSPICRRAGCVADGIPDIWRRCVGARPQNGLSLLSLQIVSPGVCARQEHRHAVGGETPLDAERILAMLAEHAVDYVIVGGLAVQTHGHVRTTVDIDIYPSPDPKNLARLADALNALDAEILNPGNEGLKIDAKTLPRATLWQFATRDGAIDVLFDAPGTPAYEQLRTRALEIRLGDLELAVAGRDDLISMKRASARSVDLEDIAALTELGADGSA